MQEEKNKQKLKVHNLVLESRQKLNVTGVLDIISFDDESVVVDTELGTLVINGEELRINKLSIDSSELSIEGEFDSFDYSERSNSKNKGSGFFSKMFK